MSRFDVKRGEIWLVDWSPGRGSEQLGQRPAVVVQADAANTNPRYPNTILLTLSTKGLSVATHVRITPEPANGLREVSWVKAEQVLTVSKDRLVNRWGVLSAADLRKVGAALKAALGLA